VPPIPRASLLSILVLISALTTFAQSPCTGYENTCRGHFFTLGNDYPYFEDVDIWSQKVVGTTEQTLHSSCFDYPEVPGTPPPSGLLQSTALFNAVIRAYVRVDCFYDMPSTPDRYELKLYVDGVQIAGATKLAKRIPGTSQFMVPQGEIITGLATNLSAGTIHHVEVRAVMVDGGSAKFAVAYMTAQGVPATYPATKVLAAPSLTVSSSWVQASSTATIATSGTKDVILQAYTQFAGGTPNDAVEYEFKYKKSADSTWTGLGVTTAAVPCPIDAGASCAPFAYPADSTPVLDHKYSLNFGAVSTNWNFALFARNVSGHTTTLAYRHIEVFTMPSTGVTGQVEIVPPITGPTIVYPEGTSPQPPIASVVDHTKTDVRLLDEHRRIHDPGNIHDVELDRSGLHRVSRPR
jgi:hypothetical protein